MVSTDDVLSVAKMLDKPFTTCIIAKMIVESGKHRGVSYFRIERAVRAAVSWLVDRQVAYVVGEDVYKTASGAISKPFRYALYPGRKWNRKTRMVDYDQANIALLEKAFGFR
jgi:hypothetical protein